MQVAFESSPPHPLAMSTTYIQHDIRSLSHFRWGGGGGGDLIKPAVDLYLSVKQQTAYVFEPSCRLIAFLQESLLQQLLLFQT